MVDGEDATTLQYVDFITFRIGPGKTALRDNHEMPFNWRDQIILHRIETPQPDGVSLLLVSNTHVGVRMKSVNVKLEKRKVGPSQLSRWICMLHPSKFLMTIQAL